MESKSFGEKCIEAILPYTQDDRHDANKAITLVIGLIQEIVPDRVADTYEEGQWEPEYYQGFNACRKAILDKLK